MFKNRIPFINGDDAWVLPAGISAGLIMTAIFALGRWLAITPLNIEMGLGATITREVSPFTWVLGLLTHLIFAVSFATVYAKGFKLVGRIGWAPGLAFGIIHWIVIGVLIGILPIAHQVVEYFPNTPAHSFGASQLSRPGLFGIYLGPGTALMLFVVHLIFGTVIGVMGSKARRKSLQIAEKKATSLPDMRPQPL